MASKGTGTHTGITLLPPPHLFRKAVLELGTGEGRQKEWMLRIWAKRFKSLLSPVSRESQGFLDQNSMCGIQTMPTSQGRMG